MTLSRKYFSAPTLTRALLDAARHHGVEPDDIAYQVVDKKTGFVKAPRGVMIEVDPAAPTAAPSATDVVAPASEQAEQAASDEPRSESPSEPEPQAPLGPERESAPESEPEPEPAPAPVLEAPGEREWMRPQLEDVSPIDETVAAVEVDSEPSEPTPAPPVEPEVAAASAALRAATEEAVAAAPRELPEEVDDEAPAAVPADSDNAQVAAGEPLPRELEEAVARAIDDLACLAGLRVQATTIGQSDDGLLVEVEGPDGGQLAGRGGRALLAMQHLLPRLLFHEFGRATHCRIDCEGFQASRIDRFTELAHKAADRVRDGGRPWMLEPMAPDERRLVHIALADDAEVETESVGEGFLKRVRVSRA